MSINEYKLGDISNVKTGNLNKIDQVIDGKYVFFTRSTKILRSNVYTIDGKFTIIPGEGVFTPMWNDGKAGVHQRVYYIEAKKDYILDKYLFYWWCKNKNILYNLAVGTTVKSLRASNFQSPIIKLPNLNIQQQIIDIIEPKEKLFMKYNHLVNIESIDEFNKSWSILIDIIEPFEKFHEIINSKIEKCYTCIKEIYEKSNSTEYKKLSEIINFTKSKKNENIKEVLDLSSIDSNQINNSRFKNISDFKTNIFSIKEDQIYLSSIRPKLEKYGIAWCDSNILGTILYFDGELKYKLNALSLFCQEDFKKYLDINSYGTKMPIIDKDIVLDYDVKILEDKYLELLILINKCMKKYSKLRITLGKIINVLVEKYIK